MASASGVASTLAIVSRSSPMSDIRGGATSSMFSGTGAALSNAGARSSGGWAGSASG